eukprot:jgi/Psemu1/30735/gm1.30735_g
MTIAKKSIEDMIKETIQWPAYLKWNLADNSKKIWSFFGDSYFPCGVAFKANVLQFDGLNGAANTNCFMSVDRTHSICSVKDEGVEVNVWCKDGIKMKTPGMGISREMKKEKSVMEEHGLSFNVVTAITQLKFAV